MTTTITDDELLNQTADLLDATFELMARVEFDLNTCAFDDDPPNVDTFADDLKDAREQAVALIADAKRFYGELLCAWPESIALIP